MPKLKIQIMKQFLVTNRRRLFKNKPSGFTLMEIVVAMFIFTLASILIAEIFVNVQRAQQRIRDAQEASTNTRYLVDVISREIRFGKIDYSAGTISNNNNEKLNLIDSQNVKVSFRKASGTADCSFVDTTVSCVQIKRGNGEWNTITAPTLSVAALYFYVTPQKDPFPASVTSDTPNIQPQVTIVLHASSTGPKLENLVSTYLQTTVASRLYAR
jgi:prepilin-type N-terminal cleavage/methylation domain-containing protein